MSGCFVASWRGEDPYLLFSLSLCFLPVTRSASRVGGFTWKHGMVQRSTAADRIYIASLLRAQ